eukprot:4882588-Pleurochrysis_carterae.AAC.1
MFLTFAFVPTDRQRLSSSLFGVSAANGRAPRAAGDLHVPLPHTGGVPVRCKNPPGSLYLKASGAPQH